MAKIERMIGYVSAWRYGTKEPNPSWAMKVYEPHSKNVGTREQPKWEKNGGTTYTVKAAYGKEFRFDQYGEGDKVMVAGDLMSEDWESNGKKGKNLILKATSIEVMSNNSPQWRDAGTRDQQPAIPDNWVEVDKEAPF